MVKTTRQGGSAYSNNELGRLGAKSPLAGRKARRHMLEPNKSAIQIMLVKATN